MSLKLKKNNVELTLNLNEEFGIDFSGKTALKEFIGQAIIDRMVERTKDGKAVGGKKDLRKPYSKTYQASDDFKAAGKKANDVNLTLTGDMLGLIDIKEIKGNTIKIGWNDPEQNAKAHGHMTGKDGKVPKMKRKFFGVTKEELKDIKRKYKKDLDSAIKLKQSEGTQAFNERILSLIDELKEE